MDLVDLTIKEFSDVLSSKEPVPGGGSVAALTGLLGADLTMMVVNLTVGKKSFEEFNENIKIEFIRDFEIIKRIKDELYKLIDEDKSAFLLFMEALKLPKETEDEKNIRRDAIEKASVFALNIPMITAEKCIKLLEHQSIIAQYGNKGAISDVGVGACLILAAVESAVLNIKINLSTITDLDFKEKTLNKAEEIFNKSKKLKDEILSIVNGRI